MANRITVGIFCTLRSVRLNEPRAPLGRSDDVTLPEPPRGFCLTFSFAEGPVVITWYRQLIPVLGVTIFGDPAFDSDPAGPVQDAV